METREIGFLIPATLNDLCGRCQRVGSSIWVSAGFRARGKNAQGLEFKHNFYSGEWPNYVCSRFNDSFIAFLSSKTNGKGPKNIAYDEREFPLGSGKMVKNPIGVNSAFFDRCTPAETSCGLKNEEDGCKSGVGELLGTGFFGPVDDYCSSSGALPTTSGGAIGWLKSVSAVHPGEVIQLDFMIWNATDGSLDSSVLLDEFSWRSEETVTGTARP